MGNAVPSGVKYNNRYRGPQESLKLTQTYAQARFNINKLAKKLEQLNLIKQEVMEKPKDIQPVIASSIVMLKYMDDTLESIKNYEVNNG